MRKNNKKKTTKKKMKTFENAAAAAAAAAAAQDMVKAKVGDGEFFLPPQSSWVDMDLCRRRRRGRTIIRMVIQLV